MTIKIIFQRYIVKLLLCNILCLIVLSSCRQEDFNLELQTEKYFHIKNGDYLIPTLVRGSTTSKKIILFIQGGPGYSSLDFAGIDFPKWRNTLEFDYAVAYYDQRGTGNKQGDFSQGTSVIQTWTSDLHAVASFLQQAYDAEIILMGHSFGGWLMYKYMLEYPNNSIVSKYIAMNAPITSDGDISGLRWEFRREFLENTAQLEISKGNRVTEWQDVMSWLEENPKIEEVNGEDPFILYRQWNRYVNQLITIDYPEPEPTNQDYLRVIFSSSYNPLAYLNSQYTDEITDRIYDERIGDSLVYQLENITQPSLLLITGRYDDICPPEELTYAFNNISSEDKELVIIEGASHNPFIEQPTTFYSTIKNFIK
ncbi:alpha/beta fold hydrolase [Bernardetia sp. OM2101]|uniref:alpha/beta fold hydrolase n=1 Tax=Bernardetia sp. OM2101 TaxID=3344876 RepID=UPI0035CEC216